MVRDPHLTLADVQWVLGHAHLSTTEIYTAPAPDEVISHVLAHHERDHTVAHFHAYHAGRRASVSVDGTVLAGALEPRALAFVRDWAKLHRADLLANWERARRNEPLLAIPPLP